MTGKKIAISGDLGSGKSVTSRYIAEQLGYHYISTGEIQRQMAQERNISVLEMNKLADINFDIDKKIDETLVQINESAENYILDSRLAWFFVTKSLKIYLRTNLEITVNRILSDKKRKSENYTSREIARSEIVERKLSENSRFLIEYGIDCGDLSKYDLVIETTSVMPSDIGDKIIELFAIANYNDSPLFRYWVSPKFIFPTKNITASGDNEANKAHTELARKDDYLKDKITCIFYQGYYFITEGHEKASAALKNNVPLLPVELILYDEQAADSNAQKEQLKSAFRGTIISDWEDLHGFKYEILPGLDFVQ